MLDRAIGLVGIALALIVFFAPMRWPKMPSGVIHAGFAVAFLLIGLACGLIVADHRNQITPPSPSKTAFSWFSKAVEELDVGPEHRLPRVIEYISTVQNTQNTRGILDKDGNLVEGLDWSSAFVEWTLNQVGIRGPKNSLPFSWLNWGHPISEPEVGCIAILSIGKGQTKHVGFYVSGDKDRIKLLGGSQSNTSQEKTVSTKWFDKSALVGCRMPNTENN